MKNHTDLRIPCSHADTKELALRLEADGCDTARRWKTVIAHTETNAAADRLARRLRVKTDRGGGPVWHAAEISAGRPA